MQKKEYTEEDQRLFKVLGQQSAFELLERQRESQKKNMAQEAIEKFLNVCEAKKINNASIWQQKVKKRMQDLEARQRMQEKKAESPSPDLERQSQLITPTVNVI